MIQVCNFANSNDLPYRNLWKFEITLEYLPFPFSSFFHFYCNVSFPLLREFVQKNLSKGSLTFLTAAAVISPFSSFPSSPFAKASANRLSSPALQLFLTYTISPSSHHDLLPFAFVHKTRKLYYDSHLGFLTSRSSQVAQ